MVSFADDVFGLPVWVRLILHGAVASWLSASMLSDTHGWMATAVGAIAITWMLNLYNFMDGSDGLAGGMTLIGFGCYGLIAWSGGNTPLAMINFCIAAAAAAFLLFNFYPARIFMGDSGSIPLGFLAAVLGLVGWKNGNWPFWLPLVVFSPFIADASVTLAKRGLRGEKVWQAHREHYYQRMARGFLGHRNTALLSLWSHVCQRCQRHMGNEAGHFRPALRLHYLDGGLCSHHASIGSLVDAPLKQLLIWLSTNRTYVP